MWNNARLMDVVAKCIFALALALTIFGVAWRAANFDMFVVRGIDVVGDVTHVTREQVEAIVFGDLEGTFFTVDLRGAQAAFEKLPWVRRVDVRRHWPNRLEIIVEEHRAFARWGNSALVNDHGEVFEGASNQRLPKFDGPTGSNLDVTTNYLRFNESLERIGRHLEKVNVSERLAWRLHLDDGSVIELGRDEIAARLDSYVAAYGRSVARLKGKALHIDLRYANGFSVRVKDLQWSETRA